MRRSPRTRLCPLQFSAQLPQQELEGLFLQSHLLSTHPQLWGTGLEMLLELLEMKLDLESSREQELSRHGLEQTEWAGTGSGERQGRGEGVA